MLKYLARKILSKELSMIEASRLADHRTMKEAVEKLESRPNLYTVRIPREVYTRFRQKLPVCVVSGSSTDLQVAALVGQQQALDLIEKEFVID